MANVANDHAKPSLVMLYSITMNINSLKIILSKIKNYSE